MKLFMITEDRHVVGEIENIALLFPSWSIVHFSSIDSAWIQYFKERPDLCLVDLDACPSYRTNMDRRKILSSSVPLCIFTSSRPVSKEPRMDWVYAMKTLDYIEKPIDIDRIVFCLSIVSGPHKDISCP